jgi:hypothetical protein
MDLVGYASSDDDQPEVNAASVKRKPNVVLNAPAKR